MSLSASAAQHGMVSFFMEHLHQRGRECCASRSSPWSPILDPMHLVSQHDSNNVGIVGDICSRKNAAPITCEDIVDLHLPGMDMIADGTDGIDPYMVQAHLAPGIFPRHQVKKHRQTSGAGSTGRDSVTIICPGMTTVSCLPVGCSVFIMFTSIQILLN